MLNLNIRICSYNNNMYYRGTSYVLSVLYSLAQYFFNNKIRSKCTTTGI